ncbi:MAG: 2-C-methyl-D-erythritol 2,4-cyclodiphosphate synthase [Bacteroidota bacterium]
MAARIGLGYDVHPLVEGRKLILGGVQIPFEKGLLGHSDADALLHAICDALLGAASLGDIGTHFPDVDDAYKNISSVNLLQYTGEKIRNTKFEIINIDSTIVLQQPKISPYIEQMRKNIARALTITDDMISVKATTTEHLGFVGREEGIAVYAIASLEKLPVDERELVTFEL